MAKVKLQRVSVLAVATWHSLYCLIFAFFLGFFYLGYYYLSLGYIPRSIWYYLAVVTTAYCPLGFIAYALIALIYNALAKHIGGVTLEIKDTEHNLTPPPPPSF